MPRALDPNNTFTIWLDSDAGKDPRPEFVCRYLTGREWERLQAMGDSTGNVFRPVFDALRLGVVDWSHLVDRDGEAIYFSADQLEDVLDPFEAQELLQKMVKGGSLNGDLPKGFASPSPSAMASSAANAPPGVA